ncbi:MULTISPECIES: MarR family winged helix-turn-helix transcriptional regulator [Bacillus cereus group]|jgi:DNA-binding MarR family transcriptional regulator|uniref:MarR family winged helix-turn-helix transcriptional regulator n=1 Tax=Bacillus cereus group TaxID=86661 RepID=UPI00156B4A5C|nr:MarR family transcriptional regulator [Bacillus cereus]MDA2491412.1 MarR family transcriptional regulator [Bacillus cereus]NRS82104.1 MarR family transcriptional regulator [Bacillus cereus]
MKNSSNKLTAIDELSQAIYSLTAADGRLRGRATRTLGAVSMVHARTLKVLAEEGELSVKELADRAETTAAGITQLINGLQQAGYVERVRSNNDRRVVNVQLTPSGLNCHLEREKKLKHILNANLSDFDAEQIEKSSEIIRCLVHVLDQL